MMDALFSHRMWDRYTGYVDRYPGPESGYLSASSLLSEVFVVSLDLFPLKERFPVCANLENTFNL